MKMKKSPVALICFLATALSVAAEVPFSTPDGYVVLFEGKTTGKSGDLSPLPDGGYILKNTTGAVIYHIGDDLPIVSKDDCPNFEQINLLSGLEGAFPDLTFTVLESQKFTERSVQWSWIVGAAYGKSSQRSFVFAATQGSDGLYVIGGVSDPDKLAELKGTMRGIIVELSTDASNNQQLGIEAFAPIPSDFSVCNWSPLKPKGHPISPLTL